MPHFPKPFFRAARGLWYVQVHGRQHNLGKDRDEAFRRYRELLAGATTLRQPAANDPAASGLLVDLIDAFLEWSEKQRAPRTYQWYRGLLQSFINALPDAKSFPSDRLKPFHVMQWLDQHDTWGPSYRRKGIRAVQRVFNWAMTLGLAERNPVRGIEKPPEQVREQLISEVEYARILTLIGDRWFRDLVEFSWETGARPQETRNIEARHVNLERRRIEIPPAETKGKKRWRIIYLTDRAIDIVRWHMERHPNGPLFCNADGRPWTKNAVSNRFGRIKEALGVKYVLYSFRHSFANRMLRSGVDSLAVSSLLGHADGAMLAKVYSHLGQSVDHLRGELLKGASASVEALKNGQ